MYCLPGPSLGLWAALLPLDLNKRGPCPESCTTEGPALTLCLATPSVGVEPAGPRGRAHRALPHALAIQDPRMPALVSVQVLYRVHIPEDSQCSQRAAICMGVMDRAWTRGPGVHRYARKATWGKGWSQRLEEKGNRPEANS